MQSPMLMLEMQRLKGTWQLFLGPAMLGVLLSMMPMEAGGFSLSMQLPMFLLIGAISGWATLARPNEDLGKGMAYVLSRPVSRRQAYRSQIAIIVTGATVVALLILAVLIVRQKGLHLTWESEAMGYERMVTAVEAGFQLQFKDANTESCLGRWKAGEKPKGRECYRNFATFQAFNPWLLLVIMIWVGFLVGGAFGASIRVEGASRSRLQRFLFNPFGLTILVILFALFAPLMGSFSLRSASFFLALRPWLVPLAGVLIVAITLLAFARHWRRCEVHQE